MLKHAAVLMFATSLFASAPALAQSGGFPAGPDKALVQGKCTGCHVGSQVTSQRRTAAQWASTVETMSSYGATFSDDEFERIVNYLAKNFGPAPAGGSTARRGN